MQKIWLLSILFVGALLFSIANALPHSTPQASVLPLSASLFTVVTPSNQTVDYRSYKLETSLIHTLLIPGNSQFVVTVAIAPQLETVETFAQQQQAIAVLNGGFFDPVNQQSTSYGVVNGELVADPRLNERLVNNPDLAPYIDKILDRTEFRRYQCGTTTRYHIALHSESVPAECQLVDMLGAGPRLLPELTLEQEGFLDRANGVVVRDALGSDRPNARSAVGITHDGDLILVMAAQTSDAATASGISLSALADFMKTLGVEEAMNLDGGSSSSLYYQGETHYGKVDSAGNQVMRPVKSVLLVQENP